MKVFRRHEGAVLATIGVAAACLILYRWAWLASHRGGYELFSRQTWEEIRLYVFAGVVVLLANLLYYFFSKR